MNPNEIPVIAEILDVGAKDRVFDSLLFVGPVLILAIAVAGRSFLTTAASVIYITTFISYVLYKAV